MWGKTKGIHKLLDLLRSFTKIVGYLYKINDIHWLEWLTPVILATQEAEIRRITVLF
jgi:hypothetical protein